MLELYLDPCTVNCRKVLAGLDLLGVDYSVKTLDFFAGDQKSENFLKINPFATLPAAIDGDLTLTESNAILQYAADLVDTSAYPKDLKKRANINRWLLWETSSWFPSNYVYLAEYVVKPLLGAETDESAVAQAAEKWNNSASILDAQLAKTKWLTGDEVTIADIAVASPIHLHDAQRLPLDKYPNLKRWILEQVEKLPSWEKTQDAVENRLLPQAHAIGAREGINGGANGASSAKQVSANFNYTKVVDQPTELYFYETEASKGIHEPGDDPHEMTITDGWHRVDSFSLDKEGFSVHDFQSNYDGWDDDDVVTRDFYPEIVEFLKKTVGAKRVLVFDHTIRTEANSAKKITEETGTSQRAPVMLVHCDYTAESGPLRVRQLLPDEADDLLSRRVAFFIMWKPIRRTVEERPLAMCDVSSSPPDDFIKLYLRYRDRNGENYVMRHSPNHRWWYFPKITPDKVIVLKTYESETDGRARFLGHSAFNDPTSAPDAPFRESVEIRTMAFF